MQEHKKYGIWTEIDEITVRLECREEIFHPEGITIPQELLNFWGSPTEDTEVSLSFGGYEYILNLNVDNDSKHVQLIFDPYLEEEWRNYFDGTYCLDISKKLTEIGNGKKGKHKSILIGMYDAIFSHNKTGKRTKREQQIDPSKYDPELSAETYYDVLSDKDIIRHNWVESLYDLYQMPDHEGTCKKLEIRYGNAAWHYLKNYSNLGTCLVKATGRKAPEEYCIPKYWPILFTRKTITENGQEHFCYKLREPVQTAIRLLEKNGFFTKEKASMNQVKLNTILYGPPGTGKTYYSVIYAVAICEGKLVEEVENENYKDILARYREYMSEGRIAFTTFHQSYGYEEFIEGIRPVLSEKAQSNKNELKYILHDGIFKKLCKSAQKAKEGIIPYDENTKVWLVWLDESTKEQCFQDNVIKFKDSGDEFGDEARLNLLKQIKKGDLVLSYIGIDGKCDNFGIVQDSSPSFEYSEDENGYWVRKTEWNNNVDFFIVESILGTKAFARRKGIDKIVGLSIEDIIDLIESSLKETPLRPAKEECPDDQNNSYVLIIDEINRGNISKILGELITLIEETKREGAEEAIEAVLPYSGQTFSVPNNVYIIGTMNTADRSIALMDTALRRRFSFVEMMPNTKVLEDIGIGNVVINGVSLNIARMLNVINERIEYLYDREHTIGHAFFRKLADAPSIETLSMVFEENIIPLLQEYFYEDYEKIQLVLGDNGKEDEYKFILDKAVNERDVFNGDTDLGLSEKKFEVQHEAFKKVYSYKLIGKGI